ncbi:MAG TPA: PepSY domain-containing protein [Anaerolineales bacterium]
MKINRLAALAIIALLVAGAMGAISYRVFAQGGVLHSVRAAFQAQDCGQDQAGGTEGQETADKDNVDVQCGDQNAPDEQGTGGTEDPEAAPSGTPAMTADQAQAAALAAHPGTVRKVELDDENGQLVYGVEFEGGVDVKVDAMTGAVLSTETGQD